MSEPDEEYGEIGLQLRLRANRLDGAKNLQSIWGGPLILPEAKLTHRADAKVDPLSIWARAKASVWITSNDSKAINDVDSNQGILCVREALRIVKSFGAFQTSPKYRSPKTQAISPFT